MNPKDTANRRTMNLEELATSLGIGRSLVYDLARCGGLPVPVIKLGRRFVVPRLTVERLLGGDVVLADRQPDENSSQGS